LPIRAPRKADAPISDSGKPDLQIKAPGKLKGEAPRIEKEATIKKEVRVPFGPGSGGGTPSPVADTIRPAAITDLIATSVQGYIEILDSQLGEADYKESTLSTSAVVLTWTSPGDDGNSGTASVYDIRYSTKPYEKGWSRSAIMVNLGEGFLPKPAGTVQSRIILGLSAGTTYYFLVKAKDEANNKSTKSNIVSVTTLSASDITAPSSITSLTASNPTASSITLSWNAPGDDGNTGTATSYDVRYSPVTVTAIKWRLATQASGGPIPQIAGTSQSMTVSGLSLGVKYYFAIRTSDEAPNWSNLSNVVSLTTVGSTDYGAPSAITSLTASNPTTSSITLSWNAPGDDENTGTATSYDVRYSTSNIIDDTESNWGSTTQATGEPVPQAAGSSQSMTISGLSSGITYYFAIKTKDEVLNWSNLSNIVSLATVDPTDNSAPSAITSLTASNPTATSIALSWNAPGDDGNTGTATSYDVRYSTSNITEGNWSSAIPVSGEPIPQVSGSSESLTVSGLSPRATYYFAVKTKDEVPNESGISNVATRTTEIPDTIAPSAIDTFSSSNPIGTSIALSWNAPGDDGNTGTATSYDVRYSTSNITEGNWSSAIPVSGEPIPQVSGSSESLTVSGRLSPRATYYFAVKTKDEVPNESGISNVTTATTGDPVTVTPTPSAIDTFSSSNPTGTSITVSWIAPGADGNTGTATSYDIRYSQSIITDVNWDSATQVTGEPAPQAAGASQSMTISGLAIGTTYYFAIKTKDEVPNESGISNVANRATIVCPSISSGSQTFNMRSGPGMPQIQRITVDPLDYQIGSPQTIKVRVRDTSGNMITSVSVVFTTDSGTTTVPLPFLSGSASKSYWFGSWTPTDTRCVTYSIAVIATSASGTSQSILSPQ